MAKEVERKFLVEGSGWQALAGDGIVISQFYVAADGGRSVRVRVKDGRRATLTLKFGGAARERDEFEYDIPLADALAMRQFALGNVVEKTRHLVSHRGRTYEVDSFSQALAGLVVAELETEEDVPADELPDWVGAEVTGEPAYYNVSLALNGPPERP